MSVVALSFEAEVLADGKCARDCRDLGRLDERSGAESAMAMR